MTDETERRSLVVAALYTAIVDGVLPFAPDTADRIARTQVDTVLDMVDRAIEDERATIATWLTAKMTVRPCGPGHAGHVGIVTLLDAIEKIRKGDFS